ncbi:MAG: hypothetical protein AB7G62_10860 [Magnetospirillum sp.]
MTEHLQINDVAPRVQYLADGVQSAFTFPFAIFTETDLEIWLDESPQSSGFSISGAGISTGGTAMFNVAPTNGTRVTLRRRLSIRRTTDYQADGLIRAKTLNDEMDYQVAALQQVAEVTERSLRRSATSSNLADLTLPEPAANRSLKWNTDGSGLVNSTNDPDATGDATVAAAQAVAAAAQATAARDVVTAAVASLENPLSRDANLSDLTDHAAARANLGVPAIADIAVAARTAGTAIALDDLALIRDTSVAADRKITIGNILKAVNLLTADTSPDKTADYVMTWDASASDVRKAPLSALGGGALEFVSSQTVSSAVTAVDFTGFTAGYDYHIQFDHLAFSTTNQVLTYQMMDASGVVLSGANYKTARISVDGGTVSGAQVLNGSAVVMSGTLYHAPYGEILVIDPMGDTVNRQSWFRCGGYGSAANTWTFHQGCGHYSQSSHSGIRIKTQSANIASGKFLLWRRQRSA